MTKDQAGAEHEHVAPAETWWKDAENCCCFFVAGARVHLDTDLGITGEQLLALRDAIVRDHNSKGKLLAALEGLGSKLVNGVHCFCTFPTSTVTMRKHERKCQVANAAIAEARGDRASA